MQSAGFGRGVGAKGKEEDKASAPVTAGTRDVLKQLRQITGLDEQQLLSMNMPQIRERAISNLTERGITPEDAARLIEHLLGNEILSRRTGLDPKRLDALTFAEIQPQFMSYEQAGFTQEQQKSLNEYFSVLASVPGQINAVESGSVREVWLVGALKKAAETMERIIIGRASREDVAVNEYSFVGVMNAQQAQEVDKALEDAKINVRERGKIQAEWYGVGERTYVEARLADKNDKEARELSRNAQRDCLIPIYLRISETDRPAAERLETAVGISLRQVEIGALAVQSGNADAISAAQGAITEEQQRNVVMKYELMSAFALSALFAPFSFEAARTQAPVGAQAAATQAILAHHIQQWANLDGKMAKEVEELLDELRKKKNAEAGTVGDLKDDEFKSQLENFGIASDSTIEGAIKSLEGIMEQNNTVNEVKNSKIEVPPGSGKWVGPISAAPMETIGHNGLTVGDLALAAAEFNVTAFITLRGNTDFALPLPTNKEEVATPEAIVMAYLKNPNNEENRSNAYKVLENPQFVAIRAAFLEAIASATTKRVDGERRGSATTEVE